MGGDKKNESPEMQRASENIQGDVPDVPVCTAIKNQEHCMLSRFSFFLIGGWDNWVTPGGSQRCLEVLRDLVLSGIESPSAACKASILNPYDR